MLESREFLKTVLTTVPTDPITDRERFREVQTLALVEIAEALTHIAEALAER